MPRSMALRSSIRYGKSKMTGIKNPFASKPKASGGLIGYLAKKKGK